MKREGFTLIELLAVIVILAIIALIATPIILNIINDAKKESNERSIEMYASAVKNAVETYQLKEGKAPTTFGDLEEYITYEGAEVECDKEEIYSDGSIYLASCKVGTTTVEGYTYGEKIYYKNGEVVYFDVVKGTSCSEAEYNSSYGTATVTAWDEDEWDYIDVTVTDYLNSVTGYNGVTATNKLQNSCMKFYAYNDSEKSNTVNLLLDHNTTAIVAWNLSGSNADGPNELLTQLQSDTGSWNGTETPTNYTLDQSSATSGAKYTIDYTGYKARIISAEEIAQITGNTNWDVTSESSSWYYFDSLTTTQSDTCYRRYDSATQSILSDLSGCKYGCLYDRTYSHCTEYGCLNNSESDMHGYWTSSSQASDSYIAWYVNNDGYLSNGIVDNAESFGLRPVITVLKSKLS